MKITGADALAKELQRIGKLEGVQQVVQSNTAEMQDKMMRKVAVDTGNLKRSLMIDFLASGFTGRVGTNVLYADFLDKGTRFQSAQPYFYVSFMEQSVKFIKDLEKTLK